MDSRWNASRLPRLEGTRVVVTGASNGVGLETARELATAGAQVVLAVRNQELGEQRSAEIGADTQVRRLDLADLSSVRQFATELEGPIDVLVNNAGTVPLQREETVDGFELALGTNFLGAYALTTLLLPQITGRVVTVASNAHKGARLDRADMHLERRWGRVRAYANSKLAVMGWMLDLQRRLTESGSPVRAITTDPGWAATNLSNKPGFTAVHSLVSAVATTVANDAATGALSSLYAATGPVPTGAYVGFDGLGGIRGRVALVGRTAAASDPDLATWLTGFAARETGISA